MSERAVASLPGDFSAIRDVARARLHPALFEYVDQGSYQGHARARAEVSWSRFQVVPEFLRPDLQTQPDHPRRVVLDVVLAGQRFAAPLGLAPTTLREALHPDGERACAQVTAALGLPYVVSSNTGTRFDALGSLHPGWWLQCYLTQDRAVSEHVLQSALGAGAGALVITVDTPHVAPKVQAAPTVWDVVDPSTLRVNFRPDDVSSGRADQKARVGCADLEALVEYGVPVWVKGVLSPADVARVRELGALPWISNHGGRQLDESIDTASALHAVHGTDARTASQPASRPTLVVDGGIRSPGDILIAGALGARTALLGRGPLWALAAGGPQGLSTWLDAVTADLRQRIVLAGCRSWDDVARLAVHDSGAARV